MTKKKSYTIGFKHKVVRELLDGASPTAVAEKYKCSIHSLPGWKARYKDDVAEVVEEPKRVAKKERVLLTDQDLLAFSNPDPDFIYRGVVEDERRIGTVEKYKMAGWEPVSMSEGSFGADALHHPATPGATVSRASGLGATTYLMKKRKDWEEEDLKKKVDKKAAVEEEAIFGELDKPGMSGRISIGDRTEES